jgi:hypothetical protein
MQDKTIISIIDNIKQIISIIATKCARCDNMTCLGCVYSRGEMVGCFGQILYALHSQNSELVEKYWPTGIISYDNDIKHHDLADVFASAANISDYMQVVTPTSNNITNKTRQELQQQENLEIKTLTNQLISLICTEKNIAVSDKNENKIDTHKVCDYIKWLEGKIQANAQC